MNVATRLFARMFVLLGAAGAVVACGSGNSEPDPSSVRLGIRGGQEDSADTNVFLLVSHRGDVAALCSASLIAPNLLLTARHCVSTVAEGDVVCGMSAAGAPFAAGSFYATNVESLDAKVPTSSVFEGASVAVPPQGNDLCGFDIALVTLDRLVPSDVGVPLVPRIDRAVQTGEVYRAVGYGETTPGDAGMGGVRMTRAGLKVACAPGGACGDGAQADEFIGDTGICSGDSGGPALDADGKVVGIVSRSVSADCSSPVYGSAASWKDWITSVAQQAAVSGSYPPPFWVETGLSDPPAPGSSDLGAAGAAAAEPGSGAQGEVCTAPQDCQSGFGCFSPSSNASAAYCAAFCTTQAQCASGTVCQSGVGVCVAQADVELKSSSCAVATPGSRGAFGGGAFLGALALGLLGCRRRRVPLSRRARARLRARNFWSD